MKKLLFVFLLGGILGGCNDSPAEMEDVVDVGLLTQVIWKNASDHNISMQGTVLSVPAVTLPVGGEHVEITGNIGSYVLLEDFLRNGSMTVLFDDGLYGGVFSSESAGELNPCKESNYRFVEVKDEYMKTVIYVYTYTFTNADYEAAVASGPLEEPTE